MASIVTIVRPISLALFGWLLCLSAPLQAQATPEERVGGHPRTLPSWQCKDLTPTRSGAHLRFEFRLSGVGLAVTADTTLGPSLRVVEIAFDARGTAVQLRDRARLAGTIDQVHEIAGVRNAEGALTAREWSPRADGGVTVSALDPATLSRLDEIVRTFWAMRCPR